MSAVNPTPLVIHLSNTHSIYSEFRSHRTKMFHNLVLGLNSFLRRLHSSENLMHEDKLGGHEPHLHLVHDPLSDTLQNTKSETYISNRNCSEKCLSGFFVVVCLLVWMNVVTYSPILQYLTYWLSTTCYFVKRKCHLSDRKRVLIWILFLGCEAHIKKKKGEGAVTRNM